MAFLARRRRALVSLGVLGGALAGLGANPALAHAAPTTGRQEQSPAALSSASSVSYRVKAAVQDHPLGTPAGPAGTVVGLPSPGCSGAVLDGSVKGEGIVSVTMAGPGTDWGDATNTSVVVDVAVDSAPAQQIVLFDGAAPFSYQGFVGAMTPGTHCVTITVRPDLSHVSTVAPTVELFAVSMSVVPPTSPEYALETHAPVLYGRSTSAVGDTPLITYGQSSPDPDRTNTDLSYTVTWTHEDVGDGVVPAYEWGMWGRMTDIETVIREKVAPNGAILSAQYLSCGCESAPLYPDIVPENPLAGGETDKAYPFGASGVSPGLGHHIGIRDATGNNDISPYGSSFAPEGLSAFRFQQTLVAAPAPGQAREVAMDNNPWTYRISGKEVAREDASSTDPRSILAGQYPQYLIVDIDLASRATSSIAVEVQLVGDPTWYTNDYAQTTAPGPPTTFPFYPGGHARTVVKLPLGWNGTAIKAFRLRLNAAPGAAPSLVGTPDIHLVEVTPAYGIVHPAFPSPSIYASTQLFPTGIVGR
ncbi:MAG: hypothetical protein ACYCS7_00150 [Acidimicrobiales bacterium]